MKVLLRTRIYALWDEKSTSGSSTYCQVRLWGELSVRRASTPICTPSLRTLMNNPG